VIGYAYSGPEQWKSIPEIEKLLERAEVAGIVTQWGADSRFVWFNGRPCAELRAVRDAVSAMPGAFPEKR